MYRYMLRIMLIHVWLEKHVLYFCDGINKMIRHRFWKRRHTFPKSSTNVPPHDPLPSLSLQQNGVTPWWRSHKSGCSKVNPDLNFVFSCGAGLWQRDVWDSSSPEVSNSCGHGPSRVHRGTLSAILVPNLEKCMLI